MRKARVRGGPPTLADVVHRAAEVVDPEGHEDGVWDLLRRFEDRDEPVTAEAAADVELEIAEAKGAIDPQDEDPAVVMTAPSPRTWRIGERRSTTTPTSC